MESMESAGGPLNGMTDTIFVCNIRLKFVTGIRKFSSAEVADMCEPILKEAKLVKDEEEMEEFVHETAQKMMEAKKKQVEDDNTEEQTLECIAPPRPQPGEPIDVDCK